MFLFAFTHHHMGSAQGVGGNLANPKLEPA
jgi:hypothetical protein